MDSSAYLSRQGWRGKGHGLHSTGRGIHKPILVSRKNNAFGVGKKENDVYADQWWNRAFDSGLKSLKIGEDEALDPKRATPSDLDLLRHSSLSSKWTGLYNSFVKGDILVGTMSEFDAAKHSEPVSKPNASLKERAAAGMDAKELENRAKSNELSEDECFDNWKPQIDEPPRDKSLPVKKATSKHLRSRSATQVGASTCSSIKAISPTPASCNRGHDHSRSPCDEHGRRPLARPESLRSLKGARKRKKRSHGSKHVFDHV